MSKSAHFSKYEELARQLQRVNIAALDRDGRVAFFINIYNANTEKDQIEVLNKLNDNLSNIEDILEYNIVCAGDWNFYEDISLDTYGGNPKLKIKSIALLAKIAETTTWATSTE